MTMTPEQQAAANERLAELQRQTAEAERVRQAAAAALQRHGAGAAAVTR